MLALIAPKQNQRVEDLLRFVLAPGSQCAKGFTLFSSKRYDVFFHFQSSQVEYERTYHVLYDIASLTYLSVIYPSLRDRRHKTNGVEVRVIEYTLEGVSGAEPMYRLLTTILEPEKAPANELAALYHERWEIETAFDELKTHLRGSRVVLRSKTPTLVKQEFYGLLLAHYAIRGLMHEAALKGDIDPDTLSFTHAVRVIRRKLSHFVSIPPSGEENVS